MSVPTIVVLAKAPVPGRVKTRCCPPCTPTQAADLASAALSDTLATVLTTSAPDRVVALDGAPGPWLPPGIDVVAQCDGPLGRRIDHALAAVGGPAVLIGMDTPQVTADQLDRALQALADRQAEALVGPACDGGFWALGLAAPLPDLCAAVPMSTATTGARVAAELDRHRVDWWQLDALVDVDDFESAQLVAAALPGSRFADAVDAISTTLEVARP